jgi:nucleoside-diphosphate-sugar epimerase
VSNRIVVLGGSGFIGSAIARDLGPEVLTPGRIEADVSSRDSLARAILPGDVIINATGYAIATDRSAAGRARFRATNVEGVRNLAAVAADKGAGQLIHLSSVAAMGHWKGPGISEGMMRAATSPYAASKLDGERALEPFRDRLATTVLRPTSIFGEGRGLAATLCQLATLPLIPLPGGGRAEIPFCYVGNLAHAVRLAIGCAACNGRTFIVGDDRSYPLREVISELSRALGHRARIVAVPAAAFRLAAGASGVYAALRRTAPLLDKSRVRTLTTSVSYSTAALRDAAGYRPPYSLSDACERIARWYLDHGAQGLRP